MRRAALYQPAPTQVPFLLDKVVTWGDETTTHIKKDTLGYYYIGGVKRKLLTISCCLTTRNAGVYYDANNLARLDDEFAYLYASGVKVIRINTGYMAGVDDLTRADSVIQLAYNNKLMVIPQLAFKYVVNLGDLSDLELVVGDYTIPTYTAAWVTQSIAWDNVIGLTLENELDYPVGGATYTSVTAYLESLKALVRLQTNLPLATKLMNRSTTAAYWTIQNSAIPVFPIMCCDLYGDTAANMKILCDEWRRFCSTFGKPTTFHITEFGAPDSATVNGDAMTVAIIDSAFANGATEVSLWPGLEYTDSRGYFDGDEDVATPRANLITLMANMATWQSPL